MKLKIYSLILKAADRFWSKVDKSGVCWVWTAGTDKDGYGMISVGSVSKGTRTMVRTHRVSWIIHNGLIPKGLLVLHTCDNPPCCNPKHLFLGTNADNMRDKISKGRTKTGNVKGVKNGRAKLSDEDIPNIRYLHSTGLSNKEIARLYPVTNRTISNILLGKQWAHVT